MSTHEVFYLTFSSQRLQGLLEDAGWKVDIPGDQRSGVLRFVSDPTEGSVKLEQITTRPTGQGTVLVDVEELTGRRQAEVQTRGQYL
jgi:hypothetical protein